MVEALGDARVLTGVRWTYLSAVSRSELYSEDDGLDAAWLGQTRITYFRDRLDRVFGCEKYSVHSGDEHADLDILRAELTRADADAMPATANSRRG